MASSPSRYQSAIDALTVYSGGNVLTTMPQPNNVMLWLGGGGTTVTAAYSGGSTTLAPYINSGTAAFGMYTGEALININRTATINTNSPASNCVVFATNGNMVYGFTTLPEPQAGPYLELHEALTQLHSLDDDDWKIETSVYSASLQVAAVLLENDIPKPDVFTHGSKSVVFNWSGKDVNLYLTVSGSRLSVLVSSTEGIEYRTEFSADSGADTNRFFSALGSMRFLAPPETSVAASAANK
jgi:hypothetical protein